MAVPHDISIPFKIELIKIPETNYRKRKVGVLPDAIAIHIAEGMKASVIATFKDPGVQKSSHFLVCRDGSVVQFVSTNDISYCTGILDNPINELVLTRPGQNPNEWSISIEHEGFANQDITAAQYQTTALICKYLHDKWEIPLDRTHIFGHREVFSKKTCPAMINVEKIVQLSRILAGVGK